MSRKEGPRTKWSSDSGKTKGVLMKGGRLITVPVAVLFLIAVSAVPAPAETNYSVTLAVGGGTAAACGLYFFIHYSSGWLPQQTWQPALLSYQQEQGWHFGLPLIMMEQPEDGRPLRMYAELLRIGF